MRTIWASDGTLQLQDALEQLTALHDLVYVYSNLGGWGLHLPCNEAVDCVNATMQQLGVKLLVLPNGTAAK